MYKEKVNISCYINIQETHIYIQYTDNYIHICTYMHIHMYLCMYLKGECEKLYLVWIV